MIDVQQIFRKNENDFFSIENVFSAVRPYVNSSVTLEQQFAYTRKAGIGDIFRNLFFLRKIKGRVYHVTGDIHYAIFAFSRSKTILTIHDCVFLQNPSPVKRWIFKKLWLQWPVKYSRMVTTISNATKEEIIKNVKCDPEKITVIPDPLDEAFLYQEKEFNAAKPVILQIGTWPNKNMERVAAALENISAHLNIIGKLSEQQKAVLLCHNIEFSNSFHLSKQELIKQYADADIVVFTSTFEGFGLPILEAQAMGRVLITSNISPMKEVAGDGACFVNPFDINSIREGIAKVNGNTDFRNGLIEKGFNNVKKYYPDKIAAQYLQLYKKIIDDK
jgi:glycosyltransferase involved in cell wall biosynthesis